MSTPLSAVPKPDRAAARKLCKKMDPTDPNWPLDACWLLPLLGVPQRLEPIEVFAQRVQDLRLHRDPSRRQLDAWATALGVRDLIDLSGADYRLHTNEMLYLHGTLRANIGYRWQRENIVESLLEVALTRHEFRWYEIERRGVWASGALHPELQEAWSLVYAAYRRERAKGHIPSLDDEAVLHTDPVTLETRGGTRMALEPPLLHQCGPAGLACLLDIFVSTGSDPIAEILRKPRWQRDLDRLDPHFERPTPAPNEKPLLGWLLLLKHGAWMLHPVRCRPKKRGTGFVMRRIPMGEVSVGLCTEPQDERVARRLEMGALFGSLLSMLQGHPRVFIEGAALSPKGQALQLREVEAAVGMVEGDEGVELSLQLGGRRIDERSFMVEDLVVQVDGTQLLFATVGRSEMALFDSLKQRSIAIPKAEIGALLSRMPAWSKSVALHAEPGVLGSNVEADLRPVVRLQMEDGGLSIEVRVQPLPEVASMAPGQGSTLLAAVRDDEPVHIERDLHQERLAVDADIRPLGLPPSESYIWHLQDIQQILTVVEACRGHTEILQVRWGGKPPTVAAERLDAKDLTLRVERSRDWFGIGGTAKVGRRKVPLKSLLEAVAEGHAFVPLSTGQWVGLSDGLREHLENLATVAGEPGGKLTITPLHASLLEPLMDDGAEVDVPPGWFDVRDRLAESADLAVEVPSALCATLRPYQIEGVQWLLRMAHWAPGACLADDMGLGKTVQTLALLLARADGPALVVAPASVVINWRREMERFAPDLRPRLYWGPGRSLDGVGGGDVLLTTYGTLQRDADVLAGIRFRTVVLDEAQAIKNPSALRSRAACKLDTDFRLALSGTPVENRTEELWSLFRFVAPGLLGNHARFRRVFVQRIEARDDKAARSRLAQLVGPFLLRRTKGEVATDLPSRTEMIRRVEFSAAERALYERTRLGCIARLEESENPLAAAVELLKLRKLACHPRLYDPGSPVSSSKLKAVVRSARDLRDSGHRALIFSQFTSHLALVREALEAEGFELCYLDGSMSLRKRQMEVDRFQAGEGDLFLISLKAGGTGLNLTAATYVFHLDPWWNPAAEDQATDRAHRIGQTRAVTVVRFVTAGTVEEQIVEMHHAKRELAAALLSGQSGAARLTPEMVLGLLQTPLEDAVDALPVPELSTLAAPPIEPDGLVDRFRSHLEQKGRKQGTVRAYGNAVKHFLEWLPAEPTKEAICEHGPRFVELARAGKAGTKTDKAFARPAFRGLLEMLGTQV